MTGNGSFDSRPAPKPLSDVVDFNREIQDSFDARKVAVLSKLQRLAAVKDVLYGANSMRTQEYVVHCNLIREYKTAIDRLLQEIELLKVDARSLGLLCILDSAIDEWQENAKLKQENQYGEQQWMKCSAAATAYSSLISRKR